MTMIYKICHQKAWATAKALGVYQGSADDARDGFIHFSTAGQLGATADKHFSGQTDLVLLAVDSASLGETMKWEPSRGGALFPHCYGSLDTTLVVWAVFLERRSDGSLALPVDLP